MTATQAAMTQVFAAAMVVGVSGAFIAYVTGYRDVVLAVLLRPVIWGAWILLLPRTVYVAYMPAPKMRRRPAHRLP